MNTVSHSNNDDLAFDSQFPSIRPMFEAHIDWNTNVRAEIRYFPNITTRPLQFRFSFNIGILAHEP
jgi:hypothetical protein